MSDDIFSVATTFADVASLAQGYMNRADGEQLLLPLPSACKQGSGVRFVVYLGDGTPAFAGAGLCSQVSDQGDTVPPEERYETLINSLQLDERSRPVYEYIVAVRNAAYAQGAQAEEAPETEGVADAEVEALPAEEGYALEASYAESESGAGVDEPAEPVDLEAMSAAPADDAWSDAGSAEGAAQYVAGTDAELGEAEPAQLDPLEPVDDDSPFEPMSMAIEPQPVYAEPEAYAIAAGALQSFIPPPLPTGLLSRPARTTHWQPSPLRRPTPRPATGLFRYGTAGLPRPARPPYPELERSAFVQPAPRPTEGG
jgi:hypothetical protein